MLSVEKLISCRDRIQEEAKKYGFVNVCITAKEELEEEPFKFMVDFNSTYPPKERYFSFKKFLQELLENEYITLCYYSDLKKWLIDPGFPSIQYTLDSAIPLNELTNEPFTDQFARQIAKSQTVCNEVKEQDHKPLEKEKAAESSKKRSFEQIVNDSRNSALGKGADDSSPEKTNKEKKCKVDSKVEKIKYSKDARNLSDRGNGQSIVRGS
ncbi:hypothetical protein NF27_DT00370 [Candidatus Jidaibacter acanthamoeba]|uniref:Uncharacterized protein n=1 Tax=Candidatus Jidaibacter acanthamoebae TaxID=86105 RepID=A0A0C1QMK9_9RICK|nr:hypothetical protein [Candidatus Jidaibacter acanthamoeba]KIE05263.1 hypothetical protein NF27_DT00370 [Candidatus Jidaibacter acanthamoeba]